MAKRGRGAELNALRQKKKDEKTGSTKQKSQSSVSSNKNGGGRTGGLTRQQVQQKVSRSAGYTSSGKAKQPAQTQKTNSYATTRNIVNRSNNSKAPERASRTSNRINSSNTRGREQAPIDRRQTFATAVEMREARENERLKRNPAPTAKKMLEEREKNKDSKFAETVKNTGSASKKGLLDAASGHAQAALDTLSGLTSNEQRNYTWLRAAELSAGIDNKAETRKAAKGTLETSKQLDEERKKLNAEQEKRQEEFDKKTKNSSGLQKAIYGAAESGTGMATDLAIGRLTGTGQAGSLASMFSRTYGTTRGQAEKEGATENEDRLYAGLQAVKEVGTELMFPGVGLAKGFVGKGGIKAGERFANALTKNMRGKAADATYAGLRLLGGTAEENAEELAGWGLDPFIKDIAYGRNVRARAKESLMSDLPEITSREQAEALTARLNSDSYVNELAAEFKANGLGDKEAKELATKMRDFYAAYYSGDTDKADEIGDDLAGDLTGVKKVSKESFNTSELIETIASTTLLTATTGLPGTISTAQRGDQIKQGLKADGLKALAKEVMNSEDAEASERGKIAQAALESGNDITSTQAYDLEQGLYQQQEKDVKRQIALIDTASKQADENGYVAPYTIDEYGRITSMEKATSKAYNEAAESASETLDHVDTKESLTDIDKAYGARAIAGFKTGAFTVDDANTIVADETIKDAFKAETGIDLGQYEVKNRDGSINIPKTNAATKDALFAMATDNLVKMAETETANWKDVTKGETLRQVTARMGAKGGVAAQLVLNDVDERDTMQYRTMTAVSDYVYQSALNLGVSWEDAKDSITSQFSTIPEEKLRTLYDAGLADRQAANDKMLGLQTKVGEAMSKSAGRIDPTKGNLFIETEETPGSSATEVFRGIAESLGIDIYIVDDLPIKDSDRQANGQYVKGDIYINVNSTFEENLGFIFMHEVTHHLKQYAPEQYKALENLVREEWFKANPEDMLDRIARKIKTYEDAGQTLTEEEALEEIIADSTHEFLMDKNFAEQVSKKDPSLAKAVLSAIKNLLRKLRQIFSSGNYASSKTQMDSIFKQLGIMEEAEKLWLDAYTEAVKNKAAVGLVEWQDKVFDEARDSISNEYTIKDGKARWTDERIDNLIKQYGAEGIEEYSQAYATLISPQEYLDLTLSGRMLKRWNEGANDPDHPEVYSLNEDELREEGQTPFLQIWSSDGTRIQGHEGRHRMRALMEAGVESVPVVIIDTDTKYTKHRKPHMFLKSQDFGEGPVNANAHVMAWDLIPIKESNRDELIEKFGGEAQVRFSISEELQDGNTAVFNGKQFWSGSASRLDGFIEEVHTYAEAETWDWHHSLYFTPEQAEKINNEENVFFWVDPDGTVETEWRAGEASQDIVRAIKSQIQTRADDIRYSIPAETRKSIEDKGIDITESGTAVRYSYNSWADTDKADLLEKLVSAGYDRAAAEKWIDDVNSISAIIYGDMARLNYEADTYQDALKPNSEYFYTLDLSTLCQKRRLYQGNYNAIMRHLVHKALHPEDTVRLREMMEEMGLETPCGICYEESRKKNEGKFAETWLNGETDSQWKTRENAYKKNLEKYQQKLEEYNALEDKGKKKAPNEPKKPERWMGYKNMEHEDPYIPTLADVTTTDGRAMLRKEHPEALDAYLEYQKGRGSANPKVSFTHTDYRRDILRMTKTDVENVKHIGGLRLQSFSDFESIHTIDVMQAIMDMATLNLTAQAYTKVPAFADIFGGTGVKINLSLIQKMDENGNPVYEEYIDEKTGEKKKRLVFDSKEGIDPEEAFRIRGKHSKNVGTILVGVSDQQILDAWADDRVDMVIPFHRSGWSVKEFERLGLKGYEDYQDYQSEKIWDPKDKEWISFSAAKKKGLTFPDGTLEELYSIDYWDKNKSGKENAKEYLRLCAEQKRRPVFYNFLQDNGDGSWSLKEDGSTDGYWKSLIDYKMYDNDGNFAPQEEVKPVFDMEAAEKTLAEYNDDADTLPVNEELVAAYLKDYKKRHPRTKIDFDGDVRLSLAVDLDDQYMDAVNSGNMEEAQRLVDEAAKKAGMRVVHRYHGSMNANFTVFNKAYAKVGGNSGAGFYFSTSEDDSADHYADVEGADNYFKWSELAEHIHEAVSEGTWEGYPELGITADDIETYEDAVEAAKKYLNKEPGTFDVYLNYKNPYRRAYRDSTNIFDKIMDDFDESIVDRDEFDNEDDYYDALTEYRDEHIYDAVHRAVYGAVSDLENFYDIIGDVDTSELSSSLASHAYEYESLTWSDILETINQGTYVDLIRDDWTDSGDGSTELARAIIENFGYDAIEDSEVSSKFGQLSREMQTDTEHIIVFRPEQIKLSDPVTYAEDGSVIPLSERFDPSNDDIRYSLPTQDSDGNILTDGQMEYFKNSQARDDQGRLVPVYHTTNKGGFTVFDPSYSDDRRSLFFASNFDVSQTYGRNANKPIEFLSDDEQQLADEFPFIAGDEIETKQERQRGYYSCYLNLENPLVVDAQGASWNRIPYGSVEENPVRRETLNRMEAEAEYIINSITAEWDDFDDDFKYGDYSGDYRTLKLVISGSRRNDVGGLEAWTENKTFTADEENWAGENGEYTSPNEKLSYDLVHYWESLGLSMDYYEEVMNTIDSMDGSVDYEAITHNQEWAPDYITSDGYKMYYPEIFDEVNEELDMDYAPYEGIHAGTYKTRQLAKLAQDSGYDGVVIRNCYDIGALSHLKNGASALSDIFIAFSSNQVKDTRNENPTENPDIRYSIPPEDETMNYAQTNAETTDNLWYTDPVMHEGAIRYSMSKKDFINGTTDKWNPAWKTEGRVLKEKSVEKDIRNVIMGAMRNSDTSAKYRQKVVKDTMLVARKAFDYMKSDEHTKAAALLYDHAHSIIENLEFFGNQDESEFQRYKELKEYLRTTKITVPKDKRSDIDYEAFRRNNFRKILLGDGGIAPDKVWGHLNELWPEAFSEDIKGDIPGIMLQIENALDIYKPYAEAYSSEQCEEFAGDIANSLWDIIYEGEEYKSLADKYDDKAKAMKLRHQEAMRKVKDNYKEKLTKQALDAKRKQYAMLDRQKERYEEKLDQQKARLNARQGKALGKQKARYEKEISRLKENRKNADAKRRARREHRTLYDRILKEYKDLTHRLLNPSKDKTKNIPEQLRQPLAQMLYCFDLEKERSKKLEEMYMIPTRSQLNFRQLKDAMEQVVKEDPTAYEMSDIHKYLKDKMTNLADRVDGKSIDALDEADMQIVKDLLSGLNKAIKDGQQLEIDGENYQKQVQCDKVGEGAAEHQKIYGKAKTYDGARKIVDNILNMGELTPIYFFKGIPGMYDMYRQLRTGFDEYVRNENEIIDKIADILAPYYKTNRKGQRVQGSEIEDWRHAETAETFDLISGDQTITLTIAQRMALYCLAKRSHAQDHMYSENGGIVASEITAGSKITKAKESIKGKIVEQKPVVLTPADVDNIIASLTDDQVKIAEQLQDLMSKDMSVLGNKASMKLTGIEMYKEDNYFPIKVQDDSRPTNIDNIGIREKIRNPGFSNPLDDNAQNPIIVDDIFTVVASHCNEMNQYASYAVPITSFMKVYNGSVLDENNKPVKIKTLIRQTYGDKAITYIENFIDDINGNSFKRQGGLDDVLDKALGQAKKAAVFANLRVALQQPTAIVRAFAALDPKYFKGVKPSPKATQEMIEHCPIAQWKAWGYYDTHFGRDIEDVMMGKNVPNKMDYFMSEIYGALDNMTWGMIWQAVKNEVKTTNKGIDENSQEFWDLCNERASYVFDTTQVVDSPFHRSNDMRSKNGLVKQLTSFQAEPTLSFNVLRQGLVDAIEASKTGNNSKARKVILKTLTVWTVQALTVALAQSFVDALRRKGKKDGDDDEDEMLTWYQEIAKYFLRNFGNNLADDMNPINNVYFFKDIVPPILNAIKGEYVFGQQNLTFQWVDSLTTGIEHCRMKWEKGDAYSKSWYDCISELLGGLGYFAGVPAKTMMRGVKNAWHWFNKVTGANVFADDGSVVDSTVESVVSRFRGSGESSGSESSGTKTGSSEGGTGEPNTTREERDKAIRKEADQIKGSVADKTGEEREKATWKKVTDFIKENEGKSVEELVASGDYDILNKYRVMYVYAGNTKDYFDQRIFDESKSAMKKSILYDPTEQQTMAQQNIKDYLTSNGMSEADLSEIAYKSETKKDLAVACRIGDEDAMVESLVPLIRAGLTYEDFVRIYDNRNRVDLKKYKDKGGRYASKLKSMGTFIWPTKGVVTSHFGYRNSPTAGASSNHPAIDIGASTGTPVVAADGGVVIYAGSNGGYGNSVGIKHDNGMVTYYNHLYAWNVKVGDSVGQGQQIAQVGSTGISTGPHLDFKILDKNGKPVDPEKYLN